jgi:SAM-dependent methyltransferase
VFAVNYQRNSKGWIQFPQDDADVRKKLFPEAVMIHPARANLFMLQAIIDHLYKPGELILDPTAGTGSIMIAALSGCRVICIDTSPVFGELLQQSRASIMAAEPSADITVLQGDCLDYLPLPVNHICFSPPYAGTLLKGGGLLTKEDFGLSEEQLDVYSSGKGNVGALPEFYYYHAIEKVFNACAQSLPPEGTITIITKDHMEKGRRIHLTERLIRRAEAVGLRLRESYKWQPHGTFFITMRKQRGEAVVEDEDISVLVRRP